MKPCNYTHLIFDKGAYDGENTASSINVSGKNEYLHTGI
jgi:hypothetical protein